MSTFTRTLSLAPALLAGALMFAPAAAEACSVAAWSAVVGGAQPVNVAGGSIYKGACGLRTTNTAPSFVEESPNHSAEGGATPFTARFFVYTGLSGGSPVVFRALDADANGNSVIDVAYNTATQNFSFTVNGSTASTAAGTAPIGKWNEVLMVYKTGQAFSGETRSTGATAITDFTGSVAGLTAGAATIQRVQLGLVANGSGTGNIFIDEYEASRAATPGKAALSAMCRGDTNGMDGITAADRAVVTAAIRGTFTADRSPDCNEDGSITAADRACVTALIRAMRTCN
jgi:hypothetical protein